MGKKSSYWQSINAFRQDTWEEKDSARQCKWRKTDIDKAGDETVTDFILEQNLLERNQDKYEYNNEEYEKYGEYKDLDGYAIYEVKAEFEKHYALGKSVHGSFAYNWKKGFLFAYGRKGYEKGGLWRFIDPAMQTAFDLARATSPTHTKSNPGFVDYPNLLMMFALAVNGLGGTMKRGARNENNELRRSTQNFLKVFRWIYGGFIQAPITIAAFIVEAAYLLVKATVGVLFATVYALFPHNKKSGSGLDEPFLADEEFEEGVDVVQVQQEKALEFSRIWKKKALDVCRNNVENERELYAPFEEVQAPKRCVVM